VNTKGGHSWVNYGNPSAIHELADLVVKIKEIPIPVDPRSSLNVGMINGGTSVNSIAAQASLELDLRSESSHVLSSMTERVEKLVQDADRKGGQAIRVRAEVIGNRPAGEIQGYHPLVNAAMKCYACHGIKAKLNIGSTDANEPLSRGLPAICVGLTTGGGSHTIGEYIDTRPVSLGMEILVDLIHTIFQMD
jgi:tripeptide aminopeptidase